MMYGIGEQLWANDLLSAVDGIGGTRIPRSFDDPARRSERIGRGDAVGWQMDGGGIRYQHHGDDLRRRIMKIWPWMLVIVTLAGTSVELRKWRLGLVRQNHPAGRFRAGRKGLPDRAGYAIRTCARWVDL